MTKEEPKLLVQKHIAVTIFLVLTFSILIYYFFFYREDNTFAKKDYSSVKRVLFISSYSESFETVDLQKEGIREGFANHNIQLDIEYMDTKKYVEKENEDLFYQSLRYKLKHTDKYDAILLGDDAALEFGETYQQELFEGIPMVFFCINNIDHAIRAGTNPYITGAVEKLYLKDTIDIAIQFQPEAKKIIAIYDGALSGQGDEKQFFSAKNDYPEYQFEGINSSKYTLQEFGKKLNQISEDSILIYMSSFEDVDGNQYTIPESVQFIVTHTHVPVYRVSISTGIGKGLIGGKTVSYEKSGRKAASMVVEILNGANVADIPVVLKGESQYCFDYQILKKYNISPSLIPQDAAIVNKEQTIFEKYKRVMIPVFLFVFVCLSIILITLIDNLKRSRLTKELQESHDKLQETYSKLIVTEEKLKQQYEENQEYTKYLETKEEVIRYQAEHDYLTELPNRRSAMDMLSMLIATKQKCTVIILDIDDFKEINDSYGHACGDAVLKGISRRLLNLMLDQRFYASRLGGDEFLLIIKSIETGPDSKLMLQIKQVFSNPIIFEEKEQYIRVSMGVAYFKGGITEASEIISNADFAMYTAKKSGKNECFYYNSGMKNEMINRKKIKSILSEACRHDRFYVLYQPQVKAATGTIAGYEALLRLKDHAISPAQFISIAEETDIILTLGRIITKKVVEQMAVWRGHGLKLRPVAINFSSKQIKDKGYVCYLKNLLDKYKISPELIEIEITESIFINNNENAMKLFEDFLSIGVNLALDDFGTGYSSINYLTYIPVKKIKIDKSLVDIFLKDEKDAFIENIIRLAHCLGLKITVEGVEEKRQHERLKDFECDYIQGYYFSQPLTGEDVELLKSPIRK